MTRSRWARSSRSMALRAVELNRMRLCIGCGCADLPKLLVREIFVISWCYSIFYLGYLPFAPLKAYNYLGDYS